MKFSDMARASKTAPAAPSESSPPRGVAGQNSRLVVFICRNCGAAEVPCGPVCHSCGTKDEPRTVVYVPEKS